MENVQKILKSCRIGDLETLKLAIHLFPELINEADSKLGWTGLYCSVMCGHLEVTKFLLSNSADVNLKNRMGETALHQAVECKNIKMAKLLLKSNADPNIQQNDGETPLHVAVIKGNYKMVCILLEHHANPNIVDFVYGKSPTHYAIELPSQKIFIEIMKYHPNMGLKNRNGESPESLLQNCKNDVTATPSRFSPEASETCMTHQRSPSYTRCNSDVSLFTEKNSLDTKIRQMELMNKKIRETVRTSVDTAKKLNFSGDSAQEIETDRSASEQKLLISTMKPDLFRWLKSLRLLDEYDLLLSAGYDDVAQLAKQMRSMLPLTEKNLAKIGMKKPGHRRRLMAGLEKMNSREEESGIMQKLQCCSAFTSGIWINNLETLDRWLEDLDLEGLSETLKNAGFEEVEDLVCLANTKWEVDDVLLMDIGVEKPGYRHRILAKIRENQNRKSEEIAIDKASNNSACALCDIF